LLATTETYHPAVFCNVVRVTRCRALFIMSKSGFKPPQLKDKTKWWVCLLICFYKLFVFCEKVILVVIVSKPLSCGMVQYVCVKYYNVSEGKFSVICRTQNFHNFVKVTLTKQPKRRPTSDKLLEVR